MIKGLVFLETVVDNWWEIKQFHFMLTLFILQRDSKFGSFRSDGFGLMEGQETLQKSALRNVFYHGRFIYLIQIS